MLNRLVLAVLVALAHHAAAETRIVCYYGSWASYDGYNPEDFDATLCTHVNYAFIGLWDDGNVKVEDDYLDVDQGLYYRVTDMKKRNPHLKVLLSIGGAAAGASSLFSGMIANSGKKGAFKGSIGYFLSTYNFDGLDLDWEYPESGDKTNYINLLRELRDLCNQHGWLLTAAVSADPDHGGYDAGQMNNLLDFVNLMTYDMYGSWSAYTGQTSPLYSSSVESSWERQNLNIDAAAKNWVNAGFSKAKINIGLAFYGDTFTLSNSGQHGIHAPISGPGPNGGSVSYREICSKYGGWTRVWDNEQRNPYKYSGNQWIGYDDGDSIWIKTDYAKVNGYGGVMIWSIDQDDVHGSCGLKQTLLKHINGALGNIQCC